VSGRVQRNGESVKRAGADVAEHHAERGQGQEADRTVMAPRTVFGGMARCWVYPLVDCPAPGLGGSGAAAFKNRAERS
jgi:hypothetical protein